MEALEKTGVATVPGDGFGQKPGTNHFRTTTLVLPEESLHDAFTRFHKFNEWFHEYYKTTDKERTVHFGLGATLHN
jgi:aspartate/methionine/tyrosine aminotransferase